MSNWKSASCRARAAASVFRSAISPIPYAPPRARVRAHARVTSIAKENSAVPKEHPAVAKENSAVSRPVAHERDQRSRKRTRRRRRRARHRACSAVAHAQDELAGVLAVEEAHERLGEGVDATVDDFLARDETPFGHPAG